MKRRDHLPAISGRNEKFRETEGLFVVQINCVDEAARGRA